MQLHAAVVENGTAPLARRCIEYWRASYPQTSQPLSSHTFHSPGNRSHFFHSVGVVGYTGQKSGQSPAKLGTRFAAEPAG
jgi:hypothetical protein